MSSAIPTPEELEAWKADWHATMARAQHVADEADRLRAVALADMAGKSGILSGIPLPEEAREALVMMRRASGFLPYLPVEELPGWSRKVLEAGEILARIFGL